MNNSKGVLVSIFLKNNNRKKPVLTQRWFFTTQQKGIDFICKTFALPLLKWAERHSDQWKVIQDDLGFKGRTEEKRLEILHLDECALQRLWSYYCDQKTGEDDDIWDWDLEIIPVDVTEAPSTIDSYNLERDL
jgi:hypothetical protein